MNALSTPIIFYGKVIDQSGAPVANADIEIATGSEMGEKSNKSKIVADSNGQFTITGKGMNLFVSVSKAGYYRLKSESASIGKSQGGFDYVSNLGRGIHIPDKNSPVLFKLFKAGPIEPLNRIKRQSAKIPKDGTQVLVTLKTAQPLGHQVAVRCWTNDSQKEPDGRYDWRFEITIPNGDLVNAKDEYEFVAPESGYVMVATMEMSRSLSKPEWQELVQRSYFVRFGDGTYARLRVRMIAYGDHFALFEGWHNPKPGSRNLETDPNER